jgi:CheY-like chemotaxis protein
MNRPARRVLVVDDDDLNRLLLEQMTRQLGLEPLAAASGEDAVKACAAQRFALLLLDRWMPGLDGFETLARIRAEEAGAGLLPVPAALLTGDTEFDADLAAAGFQAMLAKPFRRDELAALIERLLGRDDPPG